MKEILWRVLSCMVKRSYIADYTPVGLLKHWINPANAVWVLERWWQCCQTGLILIEPLHVRQWLSFVRSHMLISWILYIDINRTNVTERECNMFSHPSWLLVVPCSFLLAHSEFCRLTLNSQSSCLHLLCSSDYRLSSLVAQCWTIRWLYLPPPCFICWVEIVIISTSQSVIQISQVNEDQFNMQPKPLGICLARNSCSGNHRANYHTAFPVTYQLICRVNEMVSVGRTMISF